MMKKAEIIDACTKPRPLEILSRESFRVAHLSALAEGEINKIFPQLRDVSHMRARAMYARATSGRAENTYDAGACGADIYALSARAAYGPPEPNREKIRTAYVRAENHDTRAATLNLPREAPYPAQAAPKCDLVFSAPPHAKSMKFSRGARAGSRRRA